MIKLFSTGRRGVSSRGLRDQSGGWGGKGRVGDVWNLGVTFSQLVIKGTLVSSIFKQLRTVVVPDVLIKFSKIEIFSSSEEVCDISISLNYILLSVTDNFGLGK